MLAAGISRSRCEKDVQKRIGLQELDLYAPIDNAHVEGPDEDDFLGCV
jgi:hypothetical protein